MQDGSPGTVVDLLRNRAGQSPDAVAACRRSDAKGWVPTTWSELWHEARYAALRLQQMGLGKGDHLAILAGTCREWLVAEMAGLTAGAVIVGVDPQTTPDEISYIIRHSQTRCLVVENHELAKRVPEDALGELRLVVTLKNSGRQLGPPVHPLLGGSVPANMSHVVFPEVLEGDPATLLYTSGTTGRPKAIEYSHGQLMVACRAIGRALPEIAPGDTVICWLPMAYLFQRMMNLFAMSRGAATFFVESPREVMACVQEVDPALFVAVPRFYEKLYEGVRERIERRPRPLQALIDGAVRIGIACARSRDVGRTPNWPLRLVHAVLSSLVLRKIRAVMGGKIKVMITGSAPMPRWLLEFFHAIGLLILEAYGVSENAVPMSSNVGACFRFGSVGKPFPENEVLVDDEGEILVRGPGVFQGYYREDGDGNLFTSEGFYRTGDLGYLDADGFLHLTGRKSDVIKTSTGRKIVPSRVEAAYAQSPHVEQIVVVGNNRKHLVALVVPARAAIQQTQARSRTDRKHSPVAPAASAALHDVIRSEIERLGQHLAPHERVLNFAIIPEGFCVARGELTPNLKVRRAKVAASYADLIDKLYEESPDADRSTSPVADG